MPSSAEDIRTDIDTLKLAIFRQVLISTYVFSAFIASNLVLFLTFIVLYIFGSVAPNPPVIVSDPIGVRMTGEGLSVIQFGKGLVLLWIIGNSVKLYLVGPPEIELEVGT